MANAQSAMLDEPFTRQVTTHALPMDGRSGPAGEGAGWLRPGRARSPFGLVLFAFLLCLVGGVEGVLQGHKILAGLERIEHSLFGLELFGGIVGGLDRQTDAAVSLVNLDDPRGDILPDLEHVLD